MNRETASHEHGFCDTPDESLTTVKKTNRKIYCISDDISAIANSKVNELVNKLNLSLASTYREKTGSRPLEENSKKAYEKHFRGLRYLFSLIGSYDSLLMLLDNPPEPFCPSMDPLAVALFVKYKRNKAGMELTDGNGNIVKDNFGNIVVCDGKWNDPKNVDQLLSAVGAIHAARGQRGPYEDCCNECIELDKVGKYH